MGSAFGTFAAEVGWKILDGGVECRVGVFAREERDKIGTQGLQFVGHGVGPF